MFRTIGWLLAGLLSIALTTLVFFPATWLASLVETQSAGRYTLGDAQGSLWQGSAFIGTATSRDEPIVPLLPGRFTWHLSPILLLGRVEITLENPAVLSQAIHITGGTAHWQIDASEIHIGAERLSSLGAPLNTIQPTGTMRLSWQPLQITRTEGIVAVNGEMNWALDDIASRLSPVKPLGSYNLALDWQGNHAQMLLKTIKGAMVLDGAGTIDNGRMQFSGTARAAKGEEERLANFLNLLGQRRQQGDQEIIALEFK